MAQNPSRAPAKEFIKKNGKWFSPLMKRELLKLTFECYHIGYERGHKVGVKEAKARITPLVNSIIDRVEHVLQEKPWKRRSRGNAKPGGSMINLFPKRTKPYFIFAPSYTHISSGVRTLHLLAHALNEWGEKAFLVRSGNDYKTSFSLNTPVLDVEGYEDGIFVYPDITWGSPPLGSMSPKFAVRYLLAPPSIDVSLQFRKDDQIWGYTTPLAKSFGSDKVLTIPTFDKSIFYPPHEPYVGMPPVKDTSARSGSCFYSHKYDIIFGHKLLPITDGMTRVEGAPEQVANILRTHETCYVYEMSEVIILAAMCGCKVVLVKTDYFNVVDPENELMHFNGWSWDDGYFYNPYGLNDVWTVVNSVEDNFETQLKRFITETQGWKS